MPDPLRPAPGVSIPVSEVVLRTMRSSGPGGQHANVTASRVEASFDVAASEAATSKTASTREAVTFACWPPGPEERLARTSISRSGISSPGRTLMSSCR